MREIIELTMEPTDQVFSLLLRQRRQAAPPQRRATGAGTQARA
jgi:hypothetical protein